MLSDSELAPGCDRTARAGSRLERHCTRAGRRFGPVILATAAVLVVLGHSSRARADPFEGLAAQGRVGLQFGVIPEFSSLMPGLFLGGGGRYGPVRFGADANLALGGSREGNGFAMMGNVLATVGIRGPIAPFTPYADLHAGPGFVQAEGAAAVDHAGWMGGAALGVAGLEREDRVGVFVQIAGYVTMGPDPVFPVFVRFGATAL
jgi:hypothetical protein